MQITQIRLRGVTKHTDLTVDLPAVGFVLVTGPNGAGKSSIVEAPGLVVWGKTLRDTPVWNEARGYKAELRHKRSTCSASITVDGTTYTREKRGSSGTVGWEGGDEFESRREATGALDEMFGSFDSWRRANVLSSHDAATFTRATSSERMRLVEDMVGVAAFDAAARSAAEDAKLAKQEHAGATRELEQLRARASSLRSWIASTPPRPSPPSAPPPIPPALAPDPEIAGLAGDLDDLAAARAEATAALAAANSTIRLRTPDAAAAARNLDSVRAQTCPMCHQAVDDPQLEAELELAVQAASADVVRARAAVAAAEAELRDIAVSTASVRAQMEPLVAAARAAELARAEIVALHRAHSVAVARHRDACNAFDAHTASIEAWRGELEQVEDQIPAVEAKAAQALKAAAIAEHAVAVLGPKGPRVPMLAARLAAIEVATNAWLAQICANRTEQLRVGLSTTKTTSRGQQRPDVNLSVAGVEHSEGYSGCSSGERRRIDVAFMLALAQVSEAASGRGGGTLFGDEVFDALDTEGVDTCGEIMADMAKSRCVVVIAHTAAERLRPYITHEIRLGET